MMPPWELIQPAWPVVIAPCDFVDCSPSPQPVKYVCVETDRGRLESEDTPSRTHAPRSHMPGGRRTTYLHPEGLTPVGHSGIRALDEEAP